VEQKLLTLPDHLSLSSIFSGIRVTRSLVFCVMFCSLSFFFWPLCSLSFHLQILITPLVSSNSSLSFCHLQILITPLVSSNSSLSFCHLQILITPLVSSNSSLSFCHLQILSTPLVSSNSSYFYLWYFGLIVLHMQTYLVVKTVEFELTYKYFSDFPMFIIESNIIVVIGGFWLWSLNSINFSRSINASEVTFSSLL
jgi:hypothetical protein